MLTTASGPKRRGGRPWTSWRAEEIYGVWRLFDDYHVSWCRGPAGEVP